MNTAGSFRTCFGNCSTAKHTGDRVIGGTINRTGALRYHATTLGADSVLAQIVRLMRADLWPAVEAGKLSLPIDKTFPLGEVTEALAMMRANQHFGKIVLTM